MPSSRIANSSELFCPTRALRLLFEVVNRGERRTDRRSSQREYPGCHLLFSLQVVNTAFAEALLPRAIVQKIQSL